MTKLNRKNHSQKGLLPMMNPMDEWLLVACYRWLVPACSWQGLLWAVGHKTKK